MLTGQLARHSIAVEKTRRHIAPVGRRVQFSTGHRSVVSGKMPLQPRPGRTIFQTPAQRSRIRGTSLRRPCVVQRRRVSGQKSGHVETRRRPATHIQFVAGN